MNGQPYTMQSFERAVFEWHPDNPEPYKILLRRLGATGPQPRRMIVGEAVAVALVLLFHLEVPGGKWRTVMVRPVSAARRVTPPRHGP